VAEFVKGQQVRRKGDGHSWGAHGTIVHIEDNVAMVKYGTGDNRMIKLSDLVDATPKTIQFYVKPAPKPEPIKPGWYAIHNKITNFIYYCEQVGEIIVYYMAFNPKTGEMDFDPNFPVAVAKTLIGVRQGDLTPMEFRPKSGLTVSGLRL